MRQADSAKEGEVVVTVAATHPFSPVFEIGRGAPAQGADWAALPKTTVRAQTEETLRDVLRAASRELEVSVSKEAVQMDARLRDEQGIPARSGDIGEWLVFVGFRREDDDEIAAEYNGIKIRNWNSRINQRVVVVHDEKGRATWRRPPFDATIGELLDARDAGLIDGDPHQVYLVPSIPQGAFGLGGEWQHFVDRPKDPLGGHRRDCPGRRRGFGCLLAKNADRATLKRGGGGNRGARRRMDGEGRGASRCNEPACCETAG